MGSGNKPKAFPQISWLGKRDNAVYVPPKTMETKISSGIFKKVALEGWNEHKKKLKLKYQHLIFLNFLCHLNSFTTLLSTYTKVSFYSSQYF